MAVWLNLETGEREAEGFGTRVAGIEVSQKEGEGRAVWADEKGEAMKALAAVVQDAKRRKIVHDPKLFQLLAGGAENIEHATQLYSYLVRPTTANHNFADVIFRQFNVPIGGGAGERADWLQRLAPVLRKEVEAQGLEGVYEKIDLPLSGVLAEMERTGILVDPDALAKMSHSMEKEVRRLEKEIWKLSGSEFNVNSPTQLAEILFDKLNLQPPVRRGKGKVRSTAADILEEMKEQHELAGESDRVPRDCKAEIHLRRCVAKTDSPGDEAAAHEFFADGDGDGAAQFQRSEFAEHSDSQRIGQRDSRGVRGAEGTDPAVGGLFAD